MPKVKKFGRVEFETKGFKVVPLFKNDKESGLYGIVAGKYLVSDPMPLKDAIEKLKSDGFKPKEKNKHFSL